MSGKAGGLVTCEACGIRFKIGGNVATSRVRWCPDCRDTSSTRPLLQQAERERLARVPNRCKRCGHYVEIDRNEGATVCVSCLEFRSKQEQAIRGEFLDSGVWRVGPVVFDWDGLVAVARCEACSDLNEWRWGERIVRTAINHAKLWHDITSRPYRVLAPLRAVECEELGCLGIAVTSEDEPRTLCSLHRAVAA